MVDLEPGIAEGPDSLTSFNTELERSMRQLRNFSKLILNWLPILCREAIRTSLALIQMQIVLLSQVSSRYFLNT